MQDEHPSVPSKRETLRQSIYPATSKAVAAVPGITTYIQPTIRTNASTATPHPSVPSKGETPRHNITLMYDPKLWQQCQASLHTRDYKKQRIHDDTTSIRHLINSKFCIIISRRTSRNRRRSHASNPLLSPVECDNLCVSVRLLYATTATYATWSAFLSAKILPTHSIR